MVSQQQRTRLVNHAHFLIGKAPQIGYVEQRPMQTARFRSWIEVMGTLNSFGRFSMDCSEAVTFLFRLAGLRDPNGLGYDGYGYTGSLLDHLPHYLGTEDAHEGALGVFGAGTGTHVVMLMTRRGKNPLVFSHGSEIGPLYISLDDEKAAHAGEPLTWLNIGDL